jgi:hypothetical protein
MPIGQELDADPRPESDLQHLFARLDLEQADHATGERSVGTRHDDAAQLAKRTRWPAEHVHQGALEHSHRLLLPLGSDVPLTSSQLVALPNGAQVFPPSSLARTAWVWLCGSKETV